ncbi:hypothetical protein [Deinococcus sp.]|uniref:hypothetical protein n=1 Tax=Deinococcus sp. TaxID=47478 RepID=UPI003919FBFB
MTLSRHRWSALRAVLSPRTVLGTGLDALLIGTLCLLWLTRLFWGHPFMRITDEWTKFTFFAHIAGSVGGAAWLCSLGLAAWHRPLDTAWWRVAAMSGLLPVAGFLTARSAAWVRRHAPGGDLEAAVMVGGAPFSENGAHE